MTGVNARFPPQAGIRPGVYAGFGATARVRAPLRPAVSGGTEGARSKGRPVLKHGPITADAEKGRERPCTARVIAKPVEQPIPSG